MLKFKTISNEVIKTCEENGYKTKVYPNWFIDSESNSGLDLTDLNNRTAIVNSMTNGEIGIHLFNQLTIERAEAIYKELGDTINLAKFLKDNNK